MNTISRKPRNSHCVSSSNSTRRLVLERLEGRDLMATFTVTNSEDAGAGSLRQAIIDANNQANGATADEIVFNIPANDLRHLYYRNDGVSGTVSANKVARTNAASDSSLLGVDPDYSSSWWTIKLESDLPAITEAVSIRGYSQSGARTNSKAVGDDAILRIEITPKLVANVPQAQLGLHVASSGNDIRGLVINNFPEDGIRIESNNNVDSQNNLIAGCFVGTDVAGLRAVGNGSNGIAIMASTHNTIGGKEPAMRNLVSANSIKNDYANVNITNEAGTLSTNPADASFNMVRGNYVGTNRHGTEALKGTNPQHQDGVRVSRSSRAIVWNNLISGNDGNGIEITFEGANFTSVQGNLIGTTADGMKALPNRLDGVQLQNGPQNTVIGGSRIAQRNIIAANGEAGINMFGADGAIKTMNNIVLGNFIGVAADGRTKLKNAKNAIFIGDPASFNTIGGAGVNRNRIAFTTSFAAIFVDGGSNNKILENVIL